MSSLTADSTITLLTAPPGSGKTLRLVWHIREALRAKDGPVYVCNVNGLTREGEFAGWLEWVDPRKWMELPSGCTLVVDEAQDFFRPDGGRNLPAYYTEMERLRHYGIRLVLATQHHTFLHTHVQKLVTRHEHLVRKNGAQSATVYRRSSIISNTSSDRSLAKEDHEQFAYPKELFDAYKSAQVHTIKRTLASKYKRALILVGVAVGLFGFVWWWLRDADQKPATDEGTKPAPSVFSSRGGREKENGSKWAVDPSQPRYLTDYAVDHAPRFGRAPWTAPVYDQRGVTADPQLYCLSSMQGDDANGQWQDFSCTCLTEQGTAYELSQADCRTTARKGPVYNPYRERTRQDQPQGMREDAYGSERLPPTSVATTVAGDVTEVGEVSNVVKAPEPHF